MADNAIRDDGFKGRLNIYTCEKCRRHIVTKDVDAGVTPFIVECRFPANDPPPKVEDKTYMATLELLQNVAGEVDTLETHKIPQYAADVLRDMRNPDAINSCNGYMQSSMYYVHDQTMRPDYVWYRPLEKDVAPSHLHHYDCGGLFLRSYEDHLKA